MRSRPVRGGLAARGAVSRAAFGAAVLVSLAVLFVPGDGVPSAPPGVDLLVHLLVFLVLAVTGRWAGARAGSLAVALLLYAGVSEVVQALAPLDRSGSPGDAAADAAGVLLGLAAWRGGQRAAGPRRR